ncbi:MAG: hypothetical protein A4E32_00863 [Methanomassiliicoccales archaeon PtaU1.Bin124]|nr:MAG: hypothetical protein A4E32_00863 [Methanomassiliicoccales archaeon PtaU1.Bin124]
MALRLLPAEELAVDKVKVLRTTCLCQMIALSRYQRDEGVVASSTEGNKCLWAEVCLGMVREPARLRDGDLNRSFTKDEEAARILQTHVAALRPDVLNGGVRTAALDLADFDPDVVIIYVTPGQALKVLLGLSYAKGEVIDNPITGQAAVCQSVARAIDTGSAILEVPCAGDRMWGLVQDDELVMVIPIGRLSQIVEGIKVTDAFSPYPFRPFLRWPALFPPEFEPTRSELEKS